MMSGCSQGASGGLDESIHLTLSIDLEFKCRDRRAIPPQPPFI